MKYLLFAVMLFTATNVKSQAIDKEIRRVIDSTVKAEIAKIAFPTLTFPNTQFGVSGTYPNQTVTILNYAAINSSSTVATKASTDVIALTNLLNPALTRIGTLEAQMTSTAKRISLLTATTIITAPN